MSNAPTEMIEDSRFPGALIHPSSFIDDGVSIATGTKVWHFCHVLSGSVIGKNCSIGQNVMIGPHVRIGDGCKIQNNVSLYEGVELGPNVFCGPSCVFTNVNTPRANVSRKAEFARTAVGEGVTIGANATIVCGHSLGAWCTIGAGAVVTRDVQEFALVVGNPAKQIGWVAKSGDRLGPDLVCPRTGEHYVELMGRLRLLAG